MNLTFQMVVAGMAAHTDINRAHEVANEVRRIHKQLKEAQTLASTYNNRERLFGMPVTNVSTHPIGLKIFVAICKFILKKSWEKIDQCVGLCVPF